MVNTTEVNRTYQHSTDQNGWDNLKTYVKKSPLTALGVAAGVGALAYGLFKPKPKPKHRFGVAAGRVAGALGKRGYPRQALRTAVGALALNLFNRRLRSRLPWR